MTLRRRWPRRCATRPDSGSPHRPGLPNVEQPQPADDFPSGTQPPGHLVCDEPAEGIARGEVGALRLTKAYFGEDLFCDALDGHRTVEALSEKPGQKTDYLIVVAKRLTMCRKATIAASCGTT